MNSNIPKAKDLTFELSKFPDRAKCNMCGDRLNPTGALAANIQVSENNIVSLFLCSPDCEQEFKDSPDSDTYIANKIRINNLKTT
jgi:hypothetical protein